MSITKVTSYELESLSGDPLDIGSPVRHANASVHSSGIIVDSLMIEGTYLYTVLWAIPPAYERMRIDSRGSIGVGTVAPSISFTVKAAG